MKKLIVLLSIISMLFVSVPAYAKVTEHEDRELLQSIGIWKEEYVNGNMTRNEFAEIVNAMKYGLAIDEVDYRVIVPVFNASNVDDFFAEILNAMNKNNTAETEKSDEDANAVILPEEQTPIEKAIDDGIMFAYDTGDTAGDYYITVDEVLYSMVKLLGFDKIADHNGGYPLSYRQVAVDEKLLAKVKLKYSNFVSYNDMAKIIKNTLLANICEIELNNGNITVKPTEDTCFLEEIYNIYKIKGQVIQNENSSVTGKSTVADNEIEVDGVVLKTESVEAPFLLGYEIEAYYKDNDGEYELVFYEPVRDNEIFLYAKDIESYEKGVLEYYLENGDTKKAKISQDAVYIYNGKAVSTVSDEMLMPEIGDITLLKVNNSKNYNVVIIEEYKNYQIDSINFEEGILYDKLSKGNFTWNENAKVEIYSAYYTPLAEKDIGEGSIVSITESVDGELLRIMVNSNTVSGNVTSVYKQDGKRFIAVDGVSYYVTADAEKYLNLPPVGSSCEFYLDIDGNIAYFNQAEILSQKPAYIINKYIDEDGLLYLKLFDGETKILSCNQKVKVDGITHKSVNAIENAVLIKTMCIYKNNSEGKITYLDFPSNGIPSAPEEEETLRSVQNIDTKTWYLPGISGFNGRFLIGSNTKVIVIPMDKDNYSEYQLTDKSYFMSDTYSGIKAYSIGDNAAYAEYIVYDRSSDNVIVKGDAQAYLVSEFTDILNEDEDIVKQMTYYDKYGNVIVKQVSEDVDISTISPGDLVKIGLRDNVVETINMVFDYSEKDSDSKGMGSEANTQYFDSYYTYAHRRIGNVMFLGNGTVVNDVYKLTTIPASCTVLKYDSKKDNVSVGSYLDIIDYEHNKTNPTYFFLHLQSGVPQNIVIWE